MSAAAGIVLMCGILAGAVDGADAADGKGAAAGRPQPAVVFLSPEVAGVGRTPEAVAQAVASVPRIEAREAAPLVERKVEGPAGGVRLSLGGRFRGTLTARVGPDGHLQRECGGGESEGEERSDSGEEGGR